MPYPWTNYYARRRLPPELDAYQNYLATTKWGRSEKHAEEASYTIHHTDLDVMVVESHEARSSQVL